MIYYAKQIQNDEVTALLTYDFEPHFEEGSDTVLIAEEEYNALMEEFKAKEPEIDPERITDSQALDIILGGETA